MAEEGRGERDRDRDEKKRREKGLFLTIMLSKKSRFSFELYLS